MDPVPVEATLEIPTTAARVHEKVAPVVADVGV